MPEICVILDSVRSAENVGSVFRTADAAGVSRIYLCGYTPAPVDRFGRGNPKLAKVALGAEATVPWEAREDVLALCRELKSRGIEVVAVEQSPRSIPYTDFVLARPAAFVFGNEVRGVSERVLTEAEAVLEIPMHGEKESLNVAVAAGVVLFRFAGSSPANTNS